MTGIVFPLPREYTSFPLTFSKEGSFGAIRRHDIHTGVDLYTTENAPVLAIEEGEVVAVGPFTGPEAESPWWLPTHVVMVEGRSGVFAYGEVSPCVEVGTKVLAGQPIAVVSPVLPPGKERTDIPGHSRYMLHLELYVQGTKSPMWWEKGAPQPPELVDPYPILVRAFNERSISLSDGEEAR